MARIIVRDGLPDDPIYKEGVQTFFLRIDPRAVRSKHATLPLDGETPPPASG
jgi:hypothetical protein